MWYLFLIFIGIIIWLKYFYEVFKYKINKTENAISELKLQLSKRFDIVPSIVETCKAILHAFNDLQTNEITCAINKYMSSTKLNDIIEANIELTLSLKAFFDNIKSHDTIIADKSFLALIRELSKIENKVNFTREIYNRVAEDMNISSKNIVFSFFSKIKKLKPYELFGEENSILNKSTITF